MDPFTEHHRWSAESPSQPLAELVCMYIHVHAHLCADFPKHRTLLYWGLKGVAK